MSYTAARDQLLSDAAPTAVGEQPSTPTGASVGGTSMSSPAADGDNASPTHPPTTIWGDDNSDDSPMASLKTSAPITTTTTTAATATSNIPTAIQTITTPLRQIPGTSASAFPSTLTRSRSSSLTRLNSPSPASIQNTGGGSAGSRGNNSGIRGGLAASRTGFGYQTPVQKTAGANARNDGGSRAVTTPKSTSSADSPRTDPRNDPRTGPRGYSSPAGSGSRASPSRPASVTSTLTSTPSYRSLFSEGLGSSSPPDHNRIMVACRIKPRGEGGSEKAHSPCVSVAGDAKTVAWAGESGAISRRFTFDYAAGEVVGQEELFEQVSSQEYNCIFFFNLHHKPKFSAKRTELLYVLVALGKDLLVSSQE